MQTQSLADSERPDYRLRFCYWAFLITFSLQMVKGQITACGFVTLKNANGNVTSIVQVKGQITACGFVTFSFITIPPSIHYCERPDYRLRYMLRKALLGESWRPLGRLRGDCCFHSYVSLILVISHSASTSSAPLPKERLF